MAIGGHESPKQKMTDDLGGKIVGRTIVHGFCPHGSWGWSMPARTVL